MLGHGQAIGSLSGHPDEVYHQWGAYDELKMLLVEMVFALDMAFEEQHLHCVLFELLAAFA